MNRPWLRRTPPLPAGPDRPRHGAGDSPDWPPLTADSPGAMVIFWLQVAGDPAQRRWAWEVLSPALRGRLAHEWTSAVSHPREDAAGRVADRTAPARVQGAFDEWISDRWGALQCVRHPADWAISRRPRVIGPDHELVLVLSAPSSSPRRGRVPGYAFDLVLDRGWRIEEITESTVLLR